MKHLNLIVITLITCAFLLGCKKEMLTNQNSTGIGLTSSFNQDGISVSNGMLVFSTKTNFDHFMSNAVKDESGTLIKNKLEPFQSSFKSYQDKIDEIRAQNESSANKRQFSVIEPSPVSKPWPVELGITTGFDKANLIEDPSFSQVVNNQGELQVENTIYKITPNGTFAVSAENFGYLKTLLDTSGYLLPQYQSQVQVIDPANALYKLNDKVYLLDTYGSYSIVDSVKVPPPNLIMVGEKSKEVNKAAPPTDPIVDCTQNPTAPGCAVVPTPTPPPTNGNTNPYANMTKYAFNDRYTFVGKILQNLFGNNKYNYYSFADRRFKVNFYAKNWLVYASTGVSAAIQKKTFDFMFSLWGAVENMDEMRLGWTPMVISSNIPAMTVPNTTAPQNPFTVAAKMTEHALKIIMNNETYYTLQVSDILNANNAFPFLSDSEKNKLNNLNIFDVNSMLQNGANTEIDALFAKLQSKAGYTPGTNKLALLNNDKIMISGGEDKKMSYQGNGSMSKIFGFETAEVGFKSVGNNTTFIFKPAKTIKVIKGSIYAVGKLNGEWRGISVVKE